MSDRLRAPRDYLSVRKNDKLSIPQCVVQVTISLLYKNCHDTHDHRLRGSASPVLTATGLVKGKWQFSTPHRIDTPQPITKKFVTGDYVGDPTAVPN